MTEQFVRKMEEGVKLLGIQLSEKQLEQFYDYFQFLVEKNKVMNLTAITEEDAVITKHFHCIREASQCDCGRRGRTGTFNSKRSGRRGCTRPGPTLCVRLLSSINPVHR